jgi:hypothetical protein
LKTAGSDRVSLAYPAQTHPIPEYEPQEKSESLRLVIFR